MASILSYCAAFPAIIVNFNRLVLIKEMNAQLTRKYEQINHKIKWQREQMINFPPISATFFVTARLRPRAVGRRQ